MVFQPSRPRLKAGWPWWPGSTCSGAGRHPRQCGWEANGSTLSRRFCRAVDDFFRIESFEIWSCDPFRGGFRRPVSVALLCPFWWNAVVSRRSGFRLGGRLYHSTGTTKRMGQGMCAGCHRFCLETTRHQASCSAGGRSKSWSSEILRVVGLHSILAHFAEQWYSHDVLDGTAGYWEWARELSAPELGVVAPKRSLKMARNQQNFPWISLCLITFKFQQCQQSFGSLYILPFY